MIKKILLGIVIVVVLLIAIGTIVVALQPAHYQVERSATINAPAPIVFAGFHDCAGLIESTLPGYAGAQQDREQLGVR